MCPIKVHNQIRPDYVTSTQGKAPHIHYLVWKDRINMISLWCHPSSTSCDWQHKRKLKTQTRLNGHRHKHKREDSITKADADTNTNTKITWPRSIASRNKGTGCNWSMQADDGFLSARPKDCHETWRREKGERQPPWHHPCKRSLYGM